MIVATNKKRVGVLGFSFKAGTDDLRESPMVVLIETLIGKGYSLSLYDRDVSIARLFGANRVYIEKEIPHISTLMRASVDDVITNSEIIVIGNKANEFQNIRARLSDDQILIDLVRIDDATSEGSYQGICW
jgi:GDP-mannose 6-dehydrogenase